MAPRQYNQNVSPTAVGYGCNASLGSASSSSTSSSSTSNSSSPIHGSPRGFHLHPTQHTTTTPAHEQHRGPRNNESNNENENNLPSPVQSDPAWPHRLLSVLRRACQNQKLRYGTAAGIILAAIACALRTRPIGTGTGTGTLQEQRQRQRRWRLVVSMVARLGALLGASTSASISILPASANPRKQAATAAATTTATTTTTTTTTNNNNNYLALAQFCNSLCATLVRWLKSPDYAHANSASLGWLKTAAERGLVQRALIGATDIVVRTTTDGWKTTALPPRSEGLKSDLVDLLTKGGCQEISKLPDTFWEKAATPLLTALPFLYLAVAYRMLRGLQNGNLNGDGGDFFSSKLLSKRGTSSFGDGARLTFKDVAGLDTILPEVREIVAYLRNPSGFHALGAEPPHGILLHGSPGLGKTMIAKAIAGEANCDAFCVCSGSDFCEMYVGRGAGRVRTLFREARRTALRNYGARKGRRLLPWPWPFSSTSTSNGNSSNGNGNSNSNNYDDKMEGDRARCLRPPTAIIFIDELDAVAKSRSYGGIANGNDERDQTLNQLLTEMDGFFRTNTTTTHRCNSTDENSVNIIVIAATNRAELLDPAILRRFDRHIRVPYPDKKGRADILKVHAIKTHCRFSTIHWEYLAEETRNFSGSDLKQVVNDAALLAVRQNSKHIEQGHLLQAIQRARATKVQNGNANAGRGTGYLPSSSMLPFVYR